MSKQYQMKLEKDGDINMREFCQRPGKRDENGKLIYTTQQSDKDKTDINKMIKRYVRTGLIKTVSRIETKYGDVTGLDFQKAMNLIVNAQAMFDELPSDIRKRFDNSPEKLLTFFEDPNNRDEAIKLGLIDKDTPTDKDGLGEHVKEPFEKKDEPSE